MPPIKDIEFATLCDDCGEPRALCTCGDDVDLDLQCSCPLCFCTHLTLAGEPCADCMAGAHQAWPAKK